MYTKYISLQIEVAINNINAVYMYFCDDVVKNVIGLPICELVSIINVHLSSDTAATIGSML